MVGHRLDYEVLEHEFLVVVGDSEVDRIPHVLPISQLALQIVNEICVS
jgi:hypothetical protein